jgi:hypothetical protein
MGRSKVEKQKADREYRQKKKAEGGSAYADKKKYIDRRSWSKKKNNMSQRDLRTHLRYRRDYMRKYRKEKVAKSVIFEIVDLDASHDNTSILSPRSVASTERERQKLKMKYKVASAENSKLKKMIQVVRRRLQTSRKNQASLNSRASPTRTHIETTLKCRKKTKLAVLSYFILLKQIKRKYGIRRGLAASFKHICKRFQGAQSQLASGLQSHSSTIRRGLDSIIRSKKIDRSIFEEFFCRDDNSRITSGKKETITRHKIKKQVSWPINYLFQNNIEVLILLSTAL